MKQSLLKAILALLLLAGLLGYVMLSSGPLAPVPVTVATVETLALQPALFGVGTVESRYTYRIGPTVAGRIAKVNVEVGERAQAGQAVAEIDPIDLDERMDAQNAAIRAAKARIEEAGGRLRESEARKKYADSQAQRYEDLRKSNSVSDENLDTRRQEAHIAAAAVLAVSAALDAARQELARLEAEQAALAQQRDNLRLRAPVDGLVVSRNADPGTTLVAGQAAVEVVDPAALWINARFDQLGATGLQAGLPASIVLRSSAASALPGKVLRLEPLADAVTEELLAKVVFDTLPEVLPPIGELAEITVTLPPLAPTPVVNNAALHVVDGHSGVWVVENGQLRFTPVRLGRGDLDGRVQILDGLSAGANIVEYSLRALGRHSRIEIVPKLPGVTP
jgi:RND family efflux transporter MFP subunit